MLTNLLYLGVHAPKSVQTHGLKKKNNNFDVSKKFILHFNRLQKVKKLHIAWMVIKDLIKH